MRLLYRPALSSKISETGACKSQTHRNHTVSHLERKQKKERREELLLHTLCSWEGPGGSGFDKAAAVQMSEVTLQLAWP